MARPEKQWLDYFSMDSEKDIKLKLLKWKYWVLWFWMYIELLQYIYKQNFYCKRDDDNMLLFCAETWLSETLTNEMLTFMLEKWLFNKELFEKYWILTSRWIQKRYIEWTKRRNWIEIVISYWLLGDLEEWKYKLLHTLNEEKHTLTEELCVKSTQTKLNYTKLKEIKEKETKEDEQDSISFSFWKVKMKMVEYEKLVETYWKSIVDSIIEDLDIYIVNWKWWRYKDHYRAVISFLKKQWAKKKPKIDVKIIKEEKEMSEETKQNAKQMFENLKKWISSKIVLN